LKQRKNPKENAYVVPNIGLPFLDRIKTSDTLLNGINIINILQVDFEPENLR
jgi:hypothetical protein